MSDFSFDLIADSFDQHIREQLPWYDLATSLITHIARFYVPYFGHIIDVGSSTGNIGRALDGLLQERDASFLAIDNEPKMVQYYNAPGEFVICDACEFDFHEKRPDLIICFLTLMFIQPKKRQLLISRMKQALHVGGALIIFDKIESTSGHLAVILRNITLGAKLAAGVKLEEIAGKELSLIGVQRPLKEFELKDFIPVFQFGEFKGFIWEKM